MSPLHAYPLYLTFFLHREQKTFFFFLNYQEQKTYFKQVRIKFYETSINFVRNPGFDLRL